MMTVFTLSKQQFGHHTPDDDQIAASKENSQVKASKKGWLSPSSSSLL